MPRFQDGNSTMICIAVRSKLYQRAQRASRDRAVGGSLLHSRDKAAAFTRLPNRVCKVMQGVSRRVGSPAHTCHTPSLSTTDGSNKSLNRCTLSRIIRVQVYHPHHTHTACHCTLIARIPAPFVCRAWNRRVPRT